MEFNNAQKLAAVLSEWARPAISQIATNKLSNVPVVHSLQQTIINSGLVGSGYSIVSEILPFFHSSLNSIVQPLLVSYIGKLPDDAIPVMAHSVVDTAMRQPSFSILDGFIEFSQDDMIELKDLLEKNLPICDNQDTYQVIK